jgi:hypothetical protein
VQVPFWLLDRDGLRRKLNLFDDGAVVCCAATGEQPSPPASPHDPLTSWVALAIVGDLELGGLGLDPHLDREQRLRVAGTVLGKDELFVVETIAVPRRYRASAARELEELVRHGSSYTDRLWAACWLILVGWTESERCGFEDVCAQFPMGELDETIYMAFARERGVSAEDAVGRSRLGRTDEAIAIHRRLSICHTYYGINGPPPSECVSRTITRGLGWRVVSRLVPDDS